MTIEIANVTKNAMLDALGIDKVGLHSGATGADGLANELSSVSYVRTPCVFRTAVNGERALAADVIFNLGSGDTVSYVSYWSGMTFVLSQSTEPAAFTTNGRFTLASTTTVLRL